jgi:hypothetical protein
MQHTLTHTHTRRLPPLGLAAFYPLILPLIVHASTRFTSPHYMCMHLFRPPFTPSTPSPLPPQNGTYLAWFPAPTLIPSLLLLLVSCPLFSSSVA